MSLRLEITEDGVPRGLIELPARGSFVLGRHESCEVVIKGSGVSRRHALLSVFEDEFAIQDLASKNGTYVNGREAKAEVLLADGDAIRLGRAVLMNVKVSSEPVKARKLEATKPVPVIEADEAATIPPERLPVAPGGGTACMSCDRPVPMPAPRIGVLRLDDGAAICPSCAAGLAKRDRIANRYRILAKIGEGGVATVYKAIDEDARRIVAVKKMKAKVPELAVAYLEREVEILRSLDHPGIARLLDAGEHAGDRFLVMELVHGADLESIIEAHERISSTDAAQIGFELASALALAHRRGVVHRDVKPSNVLIDRSGRVKLVDFGVARLGKQAQSKKASERLTVRGSRRGTPAYMAPEQARDPANAGPQA
ncbi:MAG: FHA domain-containing serine/threonine-protein kinase, partial [Planctomycetota bacterium]